MKAHKKAKELIKLIKALPSGNRSAELSLWEQVILISKERIEEMAPLTSTNTFQKLQDEMIDNYQPKPFVYGCTHKCPFDHGK